MLTVVSPTDAHTRVSANPRSSSAAADGGLEGRVNRLATEGGVLFDKAAGSFGLSSADRQRLHAIERELELDECFLTRREQRAARDGNRFDRDMPLVWRARLGDRVTVRKRKTKPERHAEVAEPDTTAAARQRARERAGADEFSRSSGRPRRKGSSQ
jgi:hypothetical protein